MKLFFLRAALLSAGLCAPVLVRAHGGEGTLAAPPDAKTAAAKAAAHAPAALHFVENRSQWPAPVRYRADVPGGALFLEAGGFAYSILSGEDMGRIHDKISVEKKSAAELSSEKMHGHAWRVHFDGCNTAAQTSATGKRAHYYNYFLGSDRTKWAAGVPAFEKVRYEELYAGIDLEVYSHGAGAKYDFLLAPGADHSLISLRFDGVEPRLRANGDLEVKTSVGTVVEEAPVAYQVVDGVQKEVACQYTLEGTTVSFLFPNGYDKSLPLVIDPTLVFATHSGSTQNTYGYSATYDNSGALYAGGYCFGTGWPVTTGAFQTAYSGSFGTDDGINKYSSDGTALIYSTYYGGFGTETPTTMVVNQYNELTISGTTSSSNLPHTIGCYDSTIGGSQDIYVAHFNAAGTALLGATYVGGVSTDGNGYRGEVLYDTSGAIVVGSETTSSDFPTTAGAYQTSYGGVTDGVLFKLDSTCSTLLWSTFLGGSTSDNIIGAALTSTGSIAVTGGTSGSFPTTTGAYQTTYGGGGSFGGGDAFVSVLDGTGSTLASSTYLGTSSVETGYRIQTGPGDTIYAMGTTDAASGVFPVSADAYLNPWGNIYFAKFSPALDALVRSTRVGSAGSSTSFGPTPDGFLYDVCGNLYFSGYSPPSDCPTTPDALPATSGFWMCVLSNNMSTLKFGTYIGMPGDHIDGGHSRFDPQGIVYHSVCHCGSGFPTTTGSYAPTKTSSGCDIASFKFNFEAIGVFAKINLGGNDSGCAPYTLPFVNASSGATSYLWDFGDGTPQYTGLTPPDHVFAAPGTYTVTLYAADTTGLACIGFDTATALITVLDPNVTAVPGVVDDTVCLGDPAVFTNSTTGATGYVWDFGDGSPAVSATAPSHTYAAPGTYTVNLIAAVTTICTAYDTATVQVTVRPYGAVAGIGYATNDSGCTPFTTAFLNASTGSTSYVWDFGDGSPTSTATDPSHTYTVAGAYTVTLYAYNSNPFVCLLADTAQDTVYVFDVDTPAISLADTLVCNADTVMLRAGVTNAASTMTYTWSPASAIVGGTANDYAYVDATVPRTITVVVNNSFAGLCTRTAMATVQVRVWDKPYTTTDTQVCPGDTAQLHAEGGIESTVRWVPSLYLSSDTARHPLAWPPAPMTYLLASALEHCADTQRATVRVAPAGVISLPDTVHVYPGEVYPMDPGGNCVYFEWFPHLGLNPSHLVSNPVASPLVNTRYFVTGTTEYGCPAKDTIDLYVLEDALLDIPNAFTPGVPGSPNNKFNVVRHGLAELSYFRVFNRWGQKIFETADINEGWDGTFNGTDQPVGVYVYTVEAVTTTGRVWKKQGNVTLVR